MEKGLKLLPSKQEVKACHWKVVALKEKLVMDLLLNLQCGTSTCYFQMGSNNADRVYYCQETSLYFPAYHGLLSVVTFLARQY